MIAGVFFYTAATFAESIDCVRCTLARPIRIHTNEQISAGDYRKLIEVVENIELADIFSVEQKADVWTEIGDLLIQEGYIAYNSVNGVMARTGQQSNKGIKSKPRLSDTGTHKNMFLAACLQWWSEYYEKGVQAAEWTDESGDDV